MMEILGDHRGPGTAAGGDGLNESAPDSPGNAAESPAMTALQGPPGTWVGFQPETIR